MNHDVSISSRLKAVRATGMSSLNEFLCSTVICWYLTALMDAFSLQLYSLKGMTILSGNISYKAVPNFKSKKWTEKLTRFHN